MPMSAHGSSHVLCSSNALNVDAAIVLQEELIERPSLYLLNCESLYLLNCEMRKEQCSDANHTAVADARRIAANTAFQPRQRAVT